MKTIRASEISAYLYCQRAWWYRRQGYAPDNQDDLAEGQEIHTRHARAVLVSGCLRWMAYLLFLIALMLITIYLTMHLL